MDGSTRRALPSPYLRKKYSSPVPVNLHLKVLAQDTLGLKVSLVPLWLECSLRVLGDLPRVRQNREGVLRNNECIFQNCLFPEGLQVKGAYACIYCCRVESLDLYKDRKYISSVHSGASDFSEHIGRYHRPSAICPKVLCEDLAREIVYPLTYYLVYLG